MNSILRSTIENHLAIVIFASNAMATSWKERKKGKNMFGLTNVWVTLIFFFYSSSFSVRSSVFISGTMYAEMLRIKTKKTESKWNKTQSEQKKEKRVFRMQESLCVKSLLISNTNYNEKWLEHKQKHTQKPSLEQSWNECVAQNSIS